MGSRIGALHAFPRPNGRGQSLSGRAIDDLGFIRATMERAVTFRAVPVWGGYGMAATAIAAALLASHASDRHAWLAIWLAAAVVAATIGLVDITLQMRRSDGLFLGVAGTRFLVALAPGFVAGAVATLALGRGHQFDLVPGTWLTCYGVALLAAGAGSVRAVRVAGVAFLAWGTLTLLAPITSGDVALALGFGGIHALLGSSAWRNARG